MVFSVYANQMSLGQLNINLKGVFRLLRVIIYLHRTEKRLLHAAFCGDTHADLICLVIGQAIFQQRPKAHPIL